MNVNLAYEYLVDKLIYILNEEAPEREKHIDTNKLPKNEWMTQGLMKSLKQKLFNKYKKATEINV